MTAARAALLAASLLVASRSAAQAPPAAAPAAREPAEDRAGIGVGIGSGGTSSLYVPFDVGSTRVELQGAYARTGTEDVHASSTLLGLGLFGLWDVAPATRGSVGGRAQYARDAVSAGDASAHADALRIAFALGAEWVPVPSVSLGAEGQAGYSIGLSNSVSGFDVSAQAILRVFLSSSKAKASASTSGGDGAGTDRPPPPVKCERDSDCSGRDICFNGRCRH